MMLLYACSGPNSEPQRSTVPDTMARKPASAAQQSKTDTANNWLDKAIERYIDTTHNEMISYQRRKVSWILDDVQKTDTAVYYIVRIGHDMAEPDGSEPRYIIDQWLYLDSVSQKLYEYDVVGDSLVK